MKKEKLKILIITYYFPPLNAIGSLRPYPWAKYWSRMGHDVHVLTARKYSCDGPLNLEVDPEVKKSVKIEELDYWSLRKFMTCLKESGSNQKSGLKDKPIEKGHGLFSTIKKLKTKMNRNLQRLTGLRPYSPHFWIGPATRRAFELYNHWPFDVVVSIYSPPSSHIIAGILKRKLNVFWLADYRNLWSRNQYYPGKWPFPLINDYIERFFIKKADLITTLSEPWKELLASRFGNKVITIANGFDVEELDKIETKDIFPKDGKIRLIYTGSIYEGKQDPLPIFEAINILRRHDPAIDEKLEILFYSDDPGNLHDLIQSYGLEDIVKTPDFVNRQTILLAQREADMLIILGWEDPSEKGVLPGKIYEYMFSGTPVLVVGGSANSILDQLIEDSGVGTIAGKSVEKTANVIRALLKGKKLEYSPSKDVLAQYTKEELAGKMLEEIIKRL